MASRRSSFGAGIICGPMLLAAILASAWPSYGQGGVTLTGEVRTKEGQVIPFGVTISLETGEGKPVGSRIADSAGNFQFLGLSPGEYHMTVTAEKFQTHEQNLDLSFHGIDYPVKVYLTPADKSQASTAALPAMTDEAASKLARKEYEKGGRALQEKKLPEARQHLEKAVAEYPCYARAEAALAQVDLAERKLPEAETRFQKAIQCDGTFLDSFSQLAQLYIVEKKFPEGETVLRQGLRLSPNAWLFHYQLGTIHGGMGKYQEAELDYLAAQSLQADMPHEFHVKLANVYLKTGEFSKALAEVDAYLRLDPNGVYAPSGRKMAETMRRDGITEPAEPPATTPASTKP